MQKTWWTVLGLIVCCLVTTFGCSSQATSKEPLAFLERIEKGDAFIKRASGGDFAKANPKDQVFEGDVIRTGEQAEAVLRFATGAVTRVLPNSEFELKPRQVAQTESKTVYTRLVKGVASFYVPKDAEAAKKFEVETQRAVASIKGTIFKVAHQPDGDTRVTVAEGVVQVEYRGAATPKTRILDVPATFQVTVTADGMSEPERTNTIGDPDLMEPGTVTTGSR